MFEFLFKLNVFVSVCNIVLFVAFIMHTIGQLTEEEIHKIQMSPKKGKRDIGFYVNTFGILLLCMTPIVNFLVMYLLTFSFNDLVNATADKLRKDLLNGTL